MRALVRTTQCLACCWMDKVVDGTIKVGANTLKASCERSEPLGMQSTPLSRYLLGARHALDAGDALHEHLRECREDEEDSSESR